MATRSELQAAHDAKWADVRAMRDRLLLACDWVVLRALETKSQVPKEWADYRQDLRDITDFLNPFFVDWPVAPVEASVRVRPLVLHPDQSVKPTGPPDRKVRK
jgi:hypothetical protein